MQGPRLTPGLRGTHGTAGRRRRTRISWQCVAVMRRSPVEVKLPRSLPRCLCSMLGGALGFAPACRSTTAYGGGSPSFGLAVSARRWAARAVCYDSTGVAPPWQCVAAMRRSPVEVMLLLLLRLHVCCAGVAARLSACHPPFHSPLCNKGKLSLRACA